MILNKEKRDKKDIYFRADKFDKQLIPIRIEGSPVYLKSINYNRLVQMYVDYAYDEYNEGYFEYLFNKREVLNLEDCIIAIKCKFDENDEYFSIKMQYKKDDGEEIDGLNIFFFNEENIHPQNFTYINNHISTTGSNIDIGIYNALEDEYIYLMTIGGSLYRIEDVYPSNLLDIYCKYKFRGILDEKIISNIYPEHNLVSIDRDYYNDSERFIQEQVSENPGACYCKLFSNFIELSNQNIATEAMDIILKLNYTLGLIINAIEDETVKGYEDADFIHASAEYVIATVYFYKEPVIVEGDMSKTYG